jgi:hypothetical protein
MRTTVAGRFGIALFVLGFVTTQPALGCVNKASAEDEEHDAPLYSMDEAALPPPTQSEPTSEVPSAVCAAVGIDQQTLPIADTGDIVAEQLRKIIVDTSEDALREKLSQAYYYYLRCM